MHIWILSTNFWVDCLLYLCPVFCREYDLQSRQLTSSPPFRPAPYPGRLTGEVHSKGLNQHGVPEMSGFWLEMEGGREQVRPGGLVSLLGCLELLDPSTYGPCTPQDGGQHCTTVFLGPRRGRKGRNHWAARLSLMASLSLTFVKCLHK